MFNGSDYSCLIKVAFIRQVILCFCVIVADFYVTHWVKSNDVIRSLFSPLALCSSARPGVTGLSFFFNFMGVGYEFLPSSFSTWEDVLCLEEVQPSSESYQI